MTIVHAKQKTKNQNKFLLWALFWFSYSCDELTTKPKSLTKDDDDDDEKMAKVEYKYQKQKTKNIVKLEKKSLCRPENK